jgi:glycerol uptake facilitator-like aquaporin
VLAVLIATLGPVSGAHFNPAVTLVTWAQRRLSPAQTVGYVAVQILGCCAGAWLAHAMFGLPLLQSSLHARTGFPQWLSEFVATGGLILVIAFCRDPGEAAWRVALWIAAAYWFTASTSFANPAITIARSMTGTFSGIRPADAPGFVLAQLAGAFSGWWLASALGRPAQAVRAS